MLKVEDVLMKVAEKTPFKFPSPTFLALVEVLVEAINQEVEAAIKRMARR